MTPLEYDIIFRGDLVFGHALVDVKSRLQHLFKVDRERVDALFSGRPVVLKRQLDEAAATRYRDVLIKAGALVDICPSGASKPPSPAPVRTRFSLAPVGARLSTTSAQESVSAPVISHLRLRPAEGYLLDSSERHPQENAPVAVPDFELAETGADLLRAEEKTSLPEQKVLAGDWELAEVGADLLHPEERPIQQAVTVSISGLDLAPAGSDLGQIKPRVAPVNPDISNIHLVSED